MNLENIHRLFNGEITIEGMNLYDPKTIINLLTLTDPSLNHKKVLVLQLWKRSQKKKKKILQNNYKQMYVSLIREGEPFPFLSLVCC